MVQARQRVQVEVRVMVQGRSRNHVGRLHGAWNGL
jgi:hypothetical protein